MATIKYKLIRKKKAEAKPLEIDEIITQFAQRVREEFSPSKMNPRVLDFQIVNDGKRLRMTTATVDGSGVPTAVERFSPDEAGRALVLRLQQAEGGGWTGAELGEHFGLSPATLHKRRSEFRIVWWKDARNQFHYPQWQFDQAGALLDGVQDVLQIFRSKDQWRVMSYFLAPWHQLDDGRPLDLLRKGQMDKVLAHAKAHAEEDSW